MGDREERARATTAPCRACRIAREGNLRVRAGDTVAGRRVGAGVARVLCVKTLPPGCRVASRDARQETLRGYDNEHDRAAAARAVEEG